MISSSCIKKILNLRPSGLSSVRRESRFSLPAALSLARCRIFLIRSSSSYTNINQLMNERITSGCMNRWMNDLHLDVWIDKLMNFLWWTDEWMDEWIERIASGCTHGWMNDIHLDVFMDEWWITSGSICRLLLPRTLSSSTEVTIVSKSRK